MVEVWIMFAKGAIGRLPSVFELPVAPVALGVVLALLADKNVR